MTVSEIAQQFIQRYTSENPFSKYELYADNCVSVEYPQGKPSWQISGLDILKEKCKKFDAHFNKIVNKKVTGPIVGDAGFSIIMSFEYINAQDEQKTMNELCVFFVENGKIVREEFIYQSDSEEF